MGYRMPMSGRQFRKALEDLKLSQLEAARRLGVSPRAVRYWIARHTSKQKPIPEPVALLIRTWLRDSR